MFCVFKEKKNIKHAYFEKKKNCIFSSVEVDLFIKNINFFKRTKKKNREVATQPLLQTRRGGHAAAPCLVGVVKQLVVSYWCGHTATLSPPLRVAMQPPLFLKIIIL